MPRLDGKVAVVTGAARGMGSLLGVSYPRARPSRGDRRPARRGRLVAAERGPSALAVAHDVRDENCWRDVPKLRSMHL